MKLDKFHVLQGNSCPIRQGHPVSGIDHGVGTGGKDSSTSPGGQNHRFRVQGLQSAMDQVPGDYTATASLFDQQCRDIPFLINYATAFHELFVHRVQQGMAGTVGGVAGTGIAGSSERSLRNTSFRGAAENHAHTFQL